jgi:hypothetical protein
MVSYRLANDIPSYCTIGQVDRIAFLLIENGGGFFANPTVLIRYYSR